MAEGGRQAMRRQEVNATGPPVNGKGDAPEQRKCRRIPKELGKRTEHNVNKQLLPCRSSLVADLQTIPVSGFEVLPGAPAGYLRITPDIFGLSAFSGGFTIRGCDYDKRQTSPSETLKYRKRFRWFFRF